MARSSSRPFICGAAAVASLFAYIIISYVIERHQSRILLGGYTVLFAAFLVLWRFSSKENIKWLIALAILFRVILLFAFPNLSDDIYRFVWDGRLINSGIHPFSHLPSFYMTPESSDVPGITFRLFHLLNSPNYFTVYPPVAQLIYWLSAAIFPDAVHGSAVVIRTFIILVEIGSIWLMMRLLDHYHLLQKNVLLYALNPLVILELTGNLHFEAFMSFFLLAAIYLLHQKKVIMAALSFALAISSKLIPLIFLPLFIRRFRSKKLLKFYLLTGLFTLILFIPLMQYDLLKGMASSLSLYFQRFEFNASIYYILREIGFYIKGYNTIALIGKYLAGASIILITAYAMLPQSKKIRLPEAMLWVLMIYLMLSTTIHPWYLTTLLALSVFTSFRFPVLWSFLIFFTYLGYTATGYKEVLWLIAVEYILTVTFMLYEIFSYYRNKNSVVTDKFTI